MHSITRRPRWSEIRAWYVPFAQIILIDTLGTLDSQFVYIVWGIDSAGEKTCLYVGKRFGPMRERLIWHLRDGSDLGVRICIAGASHPVMVEVAEVDGALDEAEAYYMRELRPKLGYRREVAHGFPNPPALVAPRKPLPHLIVNPDYHDIGFPAEELRQQLRRRHRLMTGADLRMIEYAGEIWDIGGPSQANLLDTAA